MPGSWLLWASLEDPPVLPDPQELDPQAMHPLALMVPDPPVLPDPQELDPQAMHPLAQVLCAEELSLPQSEQAGASSATSGVQPDSSSACSSDQCHSRENPKRAEVLPGTSTDQAGISSAKSGVLPGSSAEIQGDNSFVPEHAIFRGKTEQDQLKLTVSWCGSITPRTVPGVEKLPLYQARGEGLPQNIRHNLELRMIECRIMDRPTLHLLVLDPATATSSKAHIQRTSTPGCPN
ncbi:hypothetical protein ACOMHN_064831 [Nucella lapillus]